MRRCFLLLLPILLAPGSGRAATVLDQVRQAGVLRCAGVARPGLAFPAADRTWHGLEVELCRAVAVAVLGDEARIEFRGLYAPSSFEAARRGEDQLAFLTMQEMADRHLTGEMLPATPVFYLPEQVLVPGDSTAASVSDLAGKMVCFEPGTRADRDLDALVSVRGMRVFYGPFFEAEEMIDAFNVGRCDAIVGEATALAALRLNVDEARQPARLLPDILSVQPVFAAVPAGADMRWAQIVAWAMQTSLVGDRLSKRGDGASPLPPPILAPELGLDRGWQARTVAEVGSYDDLYRRALGDLSPLGLARGPNASPAEGGLLDAPYAR